MLSSVLIANRGEIACRIARTAKLLGMRTIAVYSDADRDALHVRACDEAHHIGAAPPRESYLAIEKLIAVGANSGADCVHPGYGFLAENAAFAEAVAAAGMTFVGPPPSAIRAMGLKDAAKGLMERAGVPVVPGYHGEKQEPAFLKQKAYEIGYPVLIKAVAGGGGKGMRRVDRHADFDAALEGAMREAASAFGDSRVLVEKYISAPRHVEIQVFADTHGNAVHLNERDCSLQRRHQKVIEEAPAPGMTPQVRAAMGRAAVEAARAVNYAGAGTVEFIADGSGGLRTDGFWFMEMNTRLQVEHPVTEAITGLDLVAWQFRVAAGEPLPMRQEAIPLVGHAVEARLYAEDPERGFVPSTGRLVALELPTGIRADAGIAVGMEVTPHYDPMIAKLIAHAATREQALDALASALESTVAVGPRTNVAFLAAICRHEEFRAGAFDTGFIDRNLEALGAQPRERDHAAAAAAVRHLVGATQARLNTLRRLSPERPLSPWDLDDGFVLSGPTQVPIRALVDGERLDARVGYGVDGPAVTVAGFAAADDARIFESGSATHVWRNHRQTLVQAEADDIDVEHLDGDGVIKAPMHGRILALLAAPGDAVQKGQRVAVIEAMKMEHALLAPLDGVVGEIAVAVGDQVADGAPVLVVAAASEAAQT